MKTLITISAVLISVSCTAAPELFFGLEDIPMLKERITQPEYAYIWQENITLADDYLNPESDIYIDPQQFIEQWNRSGWYDRMVHSRVEVLGFATLITGEKKYADVAVKILEYAAINQTVADEQRVPHRSYAMGLDWCGDYMSPEQKQLIIEAAADFARLKSQIVFSEQTWWYPYHNWIGVDIGAAGLIALKLRDEYPDEAMQWIRRCNEAIGAWFRNSFGRNGAQLEGTQYYSFGFTNALRYAIALKRITGTDILTGSEIEKLPQFLAMSLLPGDTEFDARNDTHYGGVGFVESSMFIHAFKSQLMAWLRDTTVTDKYSRDYTYPRGTRGFAPQRLLWQNQDIEAKSPDELDISQNAFYEQRGLAIWRTGWDKDDLMFSFEAGPYYAVTHNQADKGHFTLYGLGYRWAPDPAYGNNRTPGGRAQTDGHNCILIDGKGQMLSGAALGTEGKMVRYYNDEQYGYALADCTDAYNHTIAVQSHESSDWWEDIGSGKDNSLNRELAKRVYRHSLFIKPQGKRPAYTVIFDDVEAVSSKTNYTWQMITWPDIEFNIEQEKITLTPAQKAIDTPRMELYVDTDTNKTVSTDIYTPGDNRKPESYPRLRVKTDNTDNPKFASVLLPLQAQIASPKVEFERNDSMARVTLSWDSGHEEIITCPFEDRFEPIVKIETPQNKADHYTLTPVHPGKIGETPFWNGFSFTFTFVPAFEFDFIEGAEKYVFAATSHTGKVHRFTADRPDALLTPVWEDLAVGEVKLKAVGVDSNGKVLGISGERKFHKAAPYTGNYRDADYDYQASAREALGKVFELSYIHYWLDNDHPDPSYYDPVVGYQYAAKIISAVIDGAATYVSLKPTPKNAEQVLKIGVNAADYLLSRHFDQDYALADFPPTYDKMEPLAHMNVDNAMPMYGAEAGEAYLKLYEITGNSKYYDAAIKIAEGFKRLQLDNGSWHLLVNVKTAEPVYDNYINPQAVIDYLEIVIEKYGRDDLQPVVDKALEWTFANPIKDFNWQNQFEDSEPAHAYKNLAFRQAAGFAEYLFRKFPDDPKKIQMAKELLRFVEDQFIIWSNPPKLPARKESYWPAELYAADIWLFPCTGEQYLFWQPVNAGSSNAISAFKQAYIATGEEIYLSKAKDLADTIVYAQQNYHDGNYKTYLITAERDFWVNCATHTANVMLEFGEFLKDK